MKPEDGKFYVVRHIEEGWVTVIYYYVGAGSSFGYWAFSGTDEDEGDEGQFEILDEIDLSKYEENHNENILSE